MTSRFTLFSDPVHGFISVPRNLLLDLIGTPEVQRLRRIRQLGVGYLVFPGAEHSRFGHALGAMALMHDTLGSLQEKGTPISPGEYTAACAAALLHDLGHGPFSHTLERHLIRDFEHETMSRVLLARLNERFDGALADSLAMFDGTYHRPFFHELVASQLDMDRLDYLRRDSYYTGVVEGRVGVDRIIKTLNVAEGTDGREHVVIESKGLLAVESFLIARRLMYWQVYLHKTVLAADFVLSGLIRRARERIRDGRGADLNSGAPAFLYFLTRDLGPDDVAQEEVQKNYCALDDADILYSIKQWRSVDDPILSDLCGRVLDRRLPRVAMLSSIPDASRVDAWRQQVEKHLIAAGLADKASSRAHADFYFGVDSARHAAYARRSEAIGVLSPDGSLRELSAAAETGTIASLAREQVQPYVCHPKAVHLDTTS